MTDVPAAHPARLFLSGSLAFAGIGALPALMGAALPGWTAAYGLPEGTGMAVALFNGGAVASVALGILGLARAPMRLALLVLAAGAALLALATAWGTILAACGLAGLGYGVLAVLVNRRFLMGFGARGPGMVGVVNGLFGLGAILAPLLFLRSGAPAVAWTAAAAALLAALLCPPEPAAPSPGAAPLGLPRLGPLAWGLLLLNAAAVAAENTLVALGPAALVALEVPEDRAAAALSAFFATYVAARLGLFWVAARLPPRALFAGAASGLLLCLLLALAAPVAGFVLSGAFAGASFPTFFVWATRALGSDPRTGAAILLSGLLAATLGPLLAGATLSATSTGALFAVLSLLMALLCLALLLGWRRLGVA